MFQFVPSLVEIPHVCRTPSRFLKKSKYKYDKEAGFKTYWNKVSNRTKTVNVYKKSMDDVGKPCIQLEKHASLTLYRSSRTDNATQIFDFQWQITSDLSLIFKYLITVYFIDVLKIAFIVLFSVMQNLKICVALSNCIQYVCGPIFGLYLNLKSNSTFT